MPEARRTHKKQVPEYGTHGSTPVVSLGPFAAGCRNGPRPNPSLERTSTGLPPRSSLVHDPLRGVNPVAAAQLKR